MLHGRPSGRCLLGRLPATTWKLGAKLDRISVETYCTRELPPPHAPGSARRKADRPQVASPMPGSPWRYRHRRLKNGRGVQGQRRGRRRSADPGRDRLARTGDAGRTEERRSSAIQAGSDLGTSGPAGGGSPRVALVAVSPAEYRVMWHPWLRSPGGGARAVRATRCSGLAAGTHKVVAKTRRGAGTYL